MKNCEFARRERARDSKIAMTATQHMEIRVARFARSDVNLSGNSRAGAIEAERTLADRDAHLEHLLEAMVTGYPTCLHCSIICSVISN